MEIQISSKITQINAMGGNSALAIMTVFDHFESFIKCFHHLSSFESPFNPIALLIRCLPPGTKWKYFFQRGIFIRIQSWEAVFSSRAPEETRLISPRAKVQIHLLFHHDISSFSSLEFSKAFLRGFQCCALTLIVIT